MTTFQILQLVMRRIPFQEFHKNVLRTIEPNFSVLLSSDSDAIIKKPLNDNFF